MKAVYLKPLSTFHTILRSDTLWGLIMVALKNINGDKYFTDLLDSFINGNPPFNISSAMIFTKNGNNKKTLYFPKPLLPSEAIEISGAQEMRIYKKYKKIKWLCKEDFEKFINQELDDKGYFQKFRDSERPDDFFADDIKINTILHNTIDRMSNSTLEKAGEGQLYYKNDLFISEGGLYFLVDGNADIIEPALRFLRHFGYGGDNSTGKGFFDFELDDFRLRTPSNPDVCINLSLFVPKNEDLEFFMKNKNGFWYDLEYRAGKIGTHFSNSKEFKKNILVMMKEGSVFPYSQNISSGCLINTQIINDLKIYSFGYSVNIPGKVKELLNNA
jgi:CRISPR-associated protein Csm4